MNGILYLVATPIGNLEDITLRGIRTLKEVDIIVSEDTRQTLKLLNHLEIKKHLISYHRHSTEEKVKEIIDELLNGKNIALVSDAGTPVISDPGEEIVKIALENSIKVVPVPRTLCTNYSTYCIRNGCKGVFIYWFLTYE